MEFEVVNLLISLITAAVVWCVVKPQKVENEALHKAIDNNTAAMEELRSLIVELKTDLAVNSTDVKNLWHRIKDLKLEIDSLKEKKNDV